MVDKLFNQQMGKCMELDNISTDRVYVAKYQRHRKETDDIVT